MFMYKCPQAGILRMVIVSTSWDFTKSEWGITGFSTPVFADPE